MKDVRCVVEEVIRVINNNEKMNGVLTDIESLSIDELNELEDVLSILTTKTVNAFIIGRLLMLKNQIQIELIK